MFDLLKFPDEYKVNRAITKRRFLQSGNLTDRERDELDQHLDHVVIQYALHCEDGSEMIVLLAVLTNWSTRHNLLHLARDIAVAFPYRSLVVLQSGDYAKIVWQETHESVKGLNRSVVDRACATVLFDYANCKAGDPESTLIDSIINEFGKRKSAKELSYWWGIHMDTYWLDKRKQERQWLDCTSAVLKSVEDARTWLYLSAGEAKERSRTLEEYEEVFTDTCCAYCYPLFCELIGEGCFSDDDIDTEWLLIYTKACAHISYENYKCRLQPIQYQRIREAFESRMWPEDTIHSLETVELREVLVAALNGAYIPEPDADDYYEEPYDNDYGDCGDLEGDDD